MCMFFKPAVVTVQNTACIVHATDIKEKIGDLEQIKRLISRALSTNHIVVYACTN